MKLKNAMAAFAIVSAVSVGSSVAVAATITFGATDVDPYVEGAYTIDVARIVTSNGHCPSSPCMGLNNNEISTLTKTDGGKFTLQSLWFDLQGGGTGNTLIVTAINGLTSIAMTFGPDDYSHKNKDGYTVTFPSTFSNIDAIVFSTINGGNVRIDDIFASFIDRDPQAPPVPIPGAFVLMGTAVAGGAAVAAVRRRRRSHSA